MGNLIYGLAKKLLIHVNIEQGGGLVLRAMIEKHRMSRISGKSESSKGIHDGINPQQLDNTDSGASSQDVRAVIIVTVTTVILTESWNWRNFFMASLTHPPHMMA